MHKSICKIGALAAALLAFGVTGAHAEYPDRPIKFIAATSAGGTADLLARGLGEAMSRTLGQPIVVEDKPGADQVIGLQHVAKGQPADGYTAILMGIDGQALLPLLKKGLRFDPMTDFEFVGGIGEGRYAMVGPAGAPYANFNALMAYGKGNPGKLNYGSSGTPVRLPSLAVLRDLGVEAVHVPYPGAGPYFTAIAGGTVDWGIIGEVSATNLKPRVKIYAITGKTRSALNPDVPSFAELGFPQLVGPAYALALRAGTPQPIVDKLKAALNAAMGSPEVKAYWHKAGIEVKADSAEAAQRTLLERAALYEAILKDGAIKAE